MGEFSQESCIWAPSASSAYKNLVENLQIWGEECSPRGMKVKEIRPLMFRIDGEQRWVGQQSRRVSVQLGILEGLQIIGGFSVPTALAAIAPQYVRFINPADGHLDGAYGPRVIEQIPYIVRLLKQDPDSRQAVVMIYGPQDHRTSLDVPCTLSLQFFLRNNPAAGYPNGFEFDESCPQHGRDGGEGPCICNRWWRCGNSVCGETAWGMSCHMCGAECPMDIFAELFDSLPNPHFEEAGGPPPVKALEVEVNMRSNDVWLGVPYDVVQFSMLQEALAGELGAAVGRYTHVSGSMHLYKRDYEKAEALVADKDRLVLPAPPPLGSQPFQRSISEAYRVTVQWWVARTQKRNAPMDADVSMLEMVMQHGPSPDGGLSPFFQWCLDELKEGDTDDA